MQQPPQPARRNRVGEASTAMHACQYNIGNSCVDTGLGTGICLHGAIIGTNSMNGTKNKKKNQDHYVILIHICSYGLLLADSQYFENFQLEEN